MFLKDYPATAVTYDFDVFVKSCIDTSTSTIVADASTYDQHTTYSYDLSSEAALTIEFVDFFTASLDFCGEIDFTVTSTVVSYDTVARHLVVDSSDQSLAGTSETVTIMPYLRDYSTITGDPIDLSVHFFSVEEYFISLNTLPDFATEVFTNYTIDLATSAVISGGSANEIDSVSYLGT